MYIVVGLWHIGKDKCWYRVVVIPEVAVAGKILVDKVKARYLKMTERTPMTQHTQLLHMCWMVEVTGLVLISFREVLRNSGLVMEMQTSVVRKILWVLPSLDS